MALKCFLWQPGDLSLWEARVLSSHFWFFCIYSTVYYFYYKCLTHFHEQFTKRYLLEIWLQISNLNMWTTVSLKSSPTAVSYLFFFTLFLVLSLLPPFFSILAYSLFCFLFNLCFGLPDCLTVRYLQSESTYFMHNPIQWRQWLPWKKVTIWTQRSYTLYLIQ